LGASTPRERSIRGVAGFQVVNQQHGRKRAVVERKLDGDKTYVLWFMWCRLDAE
jgi:hypothetical protein